MEKDQKFSDNIRAPILNTIYRNPFEGLIDHSEKLNECVKYMKKCIFSYIECDFDRVDEYQAHVSKTEHEADMIKANIRAHLPKSIFMPVPKDQFQMLLHDADSILDYAEDVSVLLTMKKTCIPKKVAEDIKELTLKVLECVGEFQKVMSSLDELTNYSFRGMERDKVKDLIKNVHKLEHEADAIEFRISRDLFNIDQDILDTLSVIHLLKVIDRLGQVADKAENSGDRVRAMMAK